MPRGDGDVIGISDDFDGRGGVKSKKIVDQNVPEEGRQDTTLRTAEPYGFGQRNTIHS